MLLPKRIFKIRFWATISLLVSVLLFVVLSKAQSPLLEAITAREEGNKAMSRGAALYQQGKIDEAKAEWEKARIFYEKANQLIENTHCNVMLELANAYAKLGQRDKAISIYRKIATFYPNTAGGKFSQTVLDDVNKGKRSVVDFP